MILDAQALINKHRAKGVLLDTNLLVLYLVGKTNPRRVLDFKRTQRFDIPDFQLLERLVRWFGTLFTTPHVLTQTSDLTVLRGDELTTIRNIFRTVIKDMQECFDDSVHVSTDSTFNSLGLADAAIAVAGKRGLLVLTADLELYLTLQQRGLDTLNFSDVRALTWKYE